MLPIQQATHVISMDFDATYRDPRFSSDLRMVTQMLRARKDAHNQEVSQWRAILVTDRTHLSSLNLLLNAAADLKAQDPHHWQETLKSHLLSSHVAQFDEVRSPLHLAFRGEVITRGAMTAALCEFENLVYEFITKNPDNFMRLIVNANYQLDLERYQASVFTKDNGYEAWYKLTQNQLALEQENRGVRIPNLADQLALCLVSMAKMSNTLDYDPAHKETLLHSVADQCAMVVHFDVDTQRIERLNATKIQAYNAAAPDFRHNMKVLFQIDLAKEVEERRLAVIEMTNYVKWMPLKSKKRGLKLLDYIKNPDNANWREMVKINLGHYTGAASEQHFEDNPDLTKGFHFRFKGFGKLTFHSTLKRVEAIYTAPLAEDIIAPEL